MTRKHPNEYPGPERKERKGVTERYKQARNVHPDSLADWSMASGEAIRELITSATAEGGAILLGYSRDRGAYRIIIMDDDDKVTEWIPCSTDLDEALYNLAGLLAPKYQDVENNELQ